MQEHARGLVTWLSKRHPVTLFTKPGLGISLDGLDVYDRITGEMRADVRLLRKAKVDLWIALSAGLTAYAPALRQPLFGYVHGVDGLNPWMPTNRRLDRLSRLCRRTGLPWGKGLADGWRYRKITDGLRAAAGIFSNSAYTADVLSARFHIPRNRFEVVNPGIDSAFMQEPVRLSSGPVRLLTVTRLSEAARRKNVEGVIRALALLRDEVDLYYEIAGSGDSRTRLRTLAAGLGLREQVIFLGNLEKEALKAAYARADLFILAVEPSAADVEGFGMVYVEAAAAGLPSLAVESGGIVEACLDGITGILIKDPSARAIAEGIRRFLATRADFSADRIRDFARMRTTEATSEKLWESIERRLASRQTQ